MAGGAEQFNMFNGFDAHRAEQLSEADPDTQAEWYRPDGAESWGSTPAQIGNEQRMAEAPEAKQDAGEQAQTLTSGKVCE